jgi:hypothetical protein
MTKPTAIYQQPFTCDTSNADFAFIITKNGSNLKINGNTSHNQNNINDTSSAKENLKATALIQADNNPNTNFDVKITPNPSSGIFNIDISGQNNSNILTEIFIYNALGNIVMHEQNITKLSVDLSKQTKGVYYLKVSINSTSKYFKLIRS